ncbi:MAG: hypothetical protein ACYCOU_00560 [Sulfobacillus sp.]
MANTTEPSEDPGLGLRILRSRSNDRPLARSRREQVSNRTVCDNGMVQDLIDEAVIVVKQELRRIGMILGVMILLMTAVLFRVHL